MKAVSFPETKEMNVRKAIKLVREGQFAAEVEVELHDDGTGWAPYLSIAGAKTFDEVRAALKSRDIEAAAKHAKVYRLTPIAHTAE
jgi:hypothetical protein